MTYEEASERLHELYVKINDPSTTTKEYITYKEEYWLLSKELFESKDHYLHLLGRGQFGDVVATSCCHHCSHKEECPQFEALLEDEVITDCMLYGYF